MRNFFRFTFCFLFALSLSAQTPPTATIVNISPLNCTGLPITFSAIPSQSTVIYKWGVSSSRGITNISGVNNNTVSFTSTLNLTYTVSLTVSDSNGVSTRTTLISIARTPKAAFNAYFEDAGYPSKLVLTNYSSNSLINYWKYNDVAGIDSTVNAAKYYTAPGNYTVTLVAKGAKGCSDVSSYEFDIPKYSSIVLPNIFTPNNDNVNEVYRPVMVGISQIKARILNRNGNIVCSWDKVNGSWDGYTTSGEHCDAGTYFIVVEALGFDGQKYKLKGNITLAR